MLGLNKFKIVDLLSRLAVQHERGPRKPKNKPSSEHHHHHHHQPTSPATNSMTSHQTHSSMIPMLGGVTLEGPIDLRVQAPPTKSEALNMASMVVGKAPL